MRAARGAAIALGVLAVHGALTAWLWQRGQRATPGAAPDALVWVAAPAAMPPPQAALPQAAAARAAPRAMRPAARALAATTAPASAAAAPQPDREPAAPAAAEASAPGHGPLPSGAVLLGERTLRRAIRSVPQHAAHSVLGSTAPSVQQRLERGVAESAVADCRNAVQGLGLLGAPLLVGLTLTEKCRW